jgi:hypothetical protein
MRIRHLPLPRKINDPPTRPKYLMFNSDSKLTTTTTTLESNEQVVVVIMKEVVEEEAEVPIEDVVLTERPLLSPSILTSSHHSKCMT